MEIAIDDRVLPRVMQAIDRRNELLRMWTKDLPRDYEEQLHEAQRVIAAAVTVAIRKADRQQHSN